MMFFFKFALVQNDDKSRQLRHNIIQFLLPNTFEEIRVLNPEIVPEIRNGKRIHLDVLLKDTKTEELLAIEMQVSRYTSTQSKRFQYYGARLLSRQLRNSKQYDSLHRIYQITFIEGKCPTNNNLINNYETYNQAHEKEPDNLIIRIYVHLPIIRDIVKKRGLEGLNAFEVLCYLFESNRINDILKLEKAEGMATILMEKYKEFSENTELWSWAQAIEDGEITKRSMLAEERAEGIKQGELEMLAKMIEHRYHEKCMAWLKTLNEKQLDAISTFVFEIGDFKVFKAKIDATK